MRTRDNRAARAMKLVRILLPITQNGTIDACASAAFGLAMRFGAELEVLHPCPAPEERLPYSTELSPIYFDELIDVGRKQVALEKRQARKWFTKIARDYPKAKAELISIEALPAEAVATRAKGFGPDDRAEHRRAGGCLRVEHPRCRSLPFGPSGAGDA